MRAIVYKNYGDAGNMFLTDIPKPLPANNEVLIKVYASSVNSWDWDMVRGKPYIVRTGGWRTPRYPVLGADVAGVVESVGADVKRLKVGDRVFGDLSVCNWGGFAEYVAAKEEALALLPDAIPFTDAAAMPQAGILALQALRFGGDIKSGENILMNGAGGGVGTFVIQMANNAGAKVWSVDHGSKLEALAKQGAHKTIDYTKEDFVKLNTQFDRIIDVMALRKANQIKKALKPGGSYAIVGGKMSKIFQPRFLLNNLGCRKYNMGLVIHKPNEDDLNILAEYYRKGIIKPVIGTTYPLEETPAAIEHIAKGAAFGKLLVEVRR